MPQESLRTTFGTPAIADQADGATIYVLAGKFTCSVDAVCDGAEWFRPTNPPGTPTRLLLYRDSSPGAPIGAKDFSLGSAGWGTILYDTPIPILGNTVYSLGVLTQRYAVTTNAPWPYSNGLHLNAPALGNGCLVTTTAGVNAFPSITSGNASNFFIAPLVTVSAPKGRSIFVLGLKALSHRTLRKPLVVTSRPAPVSAQREVRYRFTSFSKKWSFVMFTQRIEASQTARIDVGVTADSQGLPYDPTSATVQFAFLSSQLAKPAPGDWVSGSWDVTRIGSYVAQCNVGSSGVTALTAGNYYTWIKITDPVAGEIPIEQIAKLIVV